MVQLGYVIDFNFYRINRGLYSFFNEKKINWKGLGK